MERQQVTVGEAAELLGTTRQKVRRLILKGVLPATQGTIDARQKLIPVEAIRALLEREGRALTALGEEKGDE